MNAALCLALEDLLANDVDSMVIHALYAASKPFIEDWEYSWSLDIMNLNFPFLN